MESLPVLSKERLNSTVFALIRCYHGSGGDTMKIFDNLRGRAAIQGTADRFGQSPEDVRREIQAAIDAAWDTDDLAAQPLKEPWENI